ncbi:hypothetical protein B9479_004131 [Cryptococcus floricola]|uniref:FAD-binding domain-containing protein n=1 Tax=Cryptococcus floricola TaxID=2591691 RepID=A0A5D3AUP3_9TREE|nr:hypothetical protein B9479_004131 [Cryptococcus floricola]
MPIPTPQQPLRIAISGGGPAGLAAAIALRQLPGVEVTIYEQATVLREIGGGIRIGYNSWKVLELLGVADKVTGHIKVDHRHMNGVTGEVVYKYPPHDGEFKYHDIRARRTVLQAALRSKVPDEVIKLQKKVQKVEQLPTGGVKLTFKDGTEATADLVIGADGLRSAVRTQTWGQHKTSWNGTTIFRCLIPLPLVDHLSISKYTAFHHGPARMFKVSVVSTKEEIEAGKGQWELTLRVFEDPKEVTAPKFSWGIPCTNERVAGYFTEFTPEIREAIDLVPEGSWKEFSAFSGPRLEHVAANGNTLLIGDASHPLLGAFGSGAGFAMEDGYLIAQILHHYLPPPSSSSSSTEERIQALSKSLDLFDKIRSPYYAKMYQVLDQPKNIENGKDFGSFSPTPGNPLGWIYGHDIGKEWEEIKATL